jgi:UDP-N-acetylmuramoyl-tripeptide--D-alanyl-D-alanine ligase
VQQTIEEPDFVLAFLAFTAILSLAPWIVLGCLRVWHFARYFQLEGYESKRYFRTLLRNSSERRFLLLGIVSAIPGFFLSILQAGPAWLLIALVSAASAIFFYLKSPRDKAVKQPFTATQRAVRLLTTALIIEALPLVLIILGIYFGNNWPGEPVGGYLTLALFFAPPIGIIIFFLTPLTLPLANLINWPIEETFRRYYLRLAKQHLKRSGATVIAITGSYGKTSTKHYLTHILNARYRVLMTPKSYNTLLGISRVINDILANDASYDYFIVEAGAYIPGEIARICKLVEPQISMVVTVGPMHLERFGSIENVVKAKYEIVEALPPEGTAIFNADDPRVRGMAERGYPQNRILVTRQDAPGACLAASNVRMTADGLNFDVCDNQTGEKRSMHAPLYGEHNVTNILMAVGVARHLGMSLNEIAGRVATLEPAEHRLVRRVMPDGSILIDDAYSANPVGTQTALQVLALQTTQPGAHRIVVSSGMFELGSLHEEENRKLGERIAAIATDVILIGAAQTKPVQEGLHSANFPPDHLHVVNTLNEAVAIYRPLLRAGDALLILTDLPDTYA